MRLTFHATHLLWFEVTAWLQGTFVIEITEVQLYAVRNWVRPFVVSYKLPVITFLLRKVEERAQLIPFDSMSVTSSYLSSAEVMDFANIRLVISGWRLWHELSIKNFHLIPGLCEAVAFITIWSTLNFANKQFTKIISVAKRSGSTNLL